MQELTLFIGFVVALSIIFSWIRLAAIDGTLKEILAELRKHDDGSASTGAARVEPESYGL